MPGATRASLPGLPKGVRPYDWALKQLRVAEAHKITRGNPEIIVAVIDVGYRHHPALNGHLWRNPRPKKGDVHGWDFVDNNASLQYTGKWENETYWSGHHVFVAGEVAAVAPQCPLMIVRVGYGKPDSWWRGIRYAVDQGARVLVTPHNYIAGERAFGDGLFYKGTDYAYPFDNVRNREALDYACDHGCLIVRAVGDNRGRRVVFPESAFDGVFTVGSINRRDEPADICCSADYVEAGAPAGQRHSQDERDRIWGCGGDRNYIPFHGGCMASGFGGGVAALILSQFPHLTNDQLRQVLRNTARPARSVKPNADGWEPKLGYGILDASRAVSLRPEQLCRDLRLIASSVRVAKRRGRFFVEAELANDGAFDAEKGIVVAYNGDPSKPADLLGTMDKAAQLLQTKQIGHRITRIRGLHHKEISCELTERPPSTIWFETYCLDRHDLGKVHHVRARGQVAPI